MSMQRWRRCARRRSAWMPPGRHWTYGFGRRDSMREGWREVRLGEVCTLHYGKALPAKSRVHGVVPVAGSSGAFDSHDSANVGTAQSIVVGRKGTAGSVTWFDQAVWVTDTAYWAEAKGVEMPFLHLLLGSVDLPSYTAQTGVPGLNRERVYSIPVAIPSRPERLRIVNLIASADDALHAALCEENRALAMLSSLRADHFAPMLTGEQSFASHLALIKKTIPIVSDRAYRIIGVLNRGRGLLDRGTKLGGDTSYEKLNVIESEQLVYSRLKAFEGAVTVTPADMESAFASAEFPAFAIGGTVSPDWLRELTRSPQLWELMASRSKGMGGRRERLKPDDFLSLPLTPPDLVEQHRVMETIRRVSATADAAHATAEALRTLRSNLLTVLLSGEHEIPESYDHLLNLAEEGAAA
ncbi:restriction endonuclease subunit S [Microbacterium sp. NPDC089987]|uniref:restriction endonuclease subunit S n=1 Tax=Microbacterium sp. NPDC089987 TaxID=3364202 RepID=UPI0037F80946